MRDQEEEMSGGIEMIRKKLVEWDFRPYHYQTFNKEESSDWRYPMNYPESWQLLMLEDFHRLCDEFKSFDFSVGTTIVGGVRLGSYSELQQITDFKA